MPGCVRLISRMGGSNGALIAASDCVAATSFPLVASLFAFSRISAHATVRCLVPDVTLRAVTATDLPELAGTFAKWGDEFEFFGFPATNGDERWYAESGCLSEDAGMLAVEADGTLVDRVTWHAVAYGPGTSSRALRIGIALLPEARGRGYGSLAQRLLADYLFATTVVRRVEAGTDIANVAEQRALERAGFVCDGVLRQAQYRDGSWHDIALYSRLRTDA
jgi:RimJ/RimL family protein N-acetyltransferase